MNLKFHVVKFLLAFLYVCHCPIHSQCGPNSFSQNEITMANFYTTYAVYFYDVAASLNLNQFEIFTGNLNTLTQSTEDIGAFLKSFRRDSPILVDQFVNSLQIYNNLGVEFLKNQTQANADKWQASVGSFNPPSGILGALNALFITTLDPATLQQLKNDITANYLGSPPEASFGFFRFQRSVVLFLSIPNGAGGANRNYDGSRRVAKNLGILIFRGVVTPQ